MMKILFTSLVICIFLGCNSTSRNQEPDSYVFENFIDTLNSNLKTNNFDFIIETIKKQGDTKFTDSQINVLNNFALKFIVKYKDLYVENSQKTKDTIFNGFILNGSKSQFKSRLSELQKEDTYKFGRLSTVVGIVEGNVGQFSNNKGSIKLLVRPFFDNSKLTSLEMHSFGLVGNDPINSEFIKVYGTPISGTDIGFNLNELRKSNLDWIGVTKSIKEGAFNPVKSFVLMGGELSKEEFKNYSNFWFTKSFVISEISILHVYQTHKEFLSEYQKKLDDIQRSKKDVKF